MIGVKPSPARHRMARDQTRDDHERFLGLSGELTLKGRRDLRFLAAKSCSANQHSQQSGSAETSEIASHLPPVGVKWKVSICSPGISLALSIQNPRSLPTTLPFAIPQLVPLSAVVFIPKKKKAFVLPRSLNRCSGTNSIHSLPNNPSIPAESAINCKSTTFPLFSSIHRPAHLSPTARHCLPVAGASLSPLSYCVASLHIHNRYCNIDINIGQHARATPCNSSKTFSDSAGR